MRVRIVVTLAAVAAGGGAAAFEPLEGLFVAVEACEATRSIRTGENPGEIRTEPSTAYAMLGANKPGGDFFQIVVPDAPEPEQRWVRATCGAHVVAAEPPEEAAEGDESSDNLLAVSWQPAFCEFRPGKTECERLNDGEIPAAETRLSVHGLWPQPRDKVYCDVDQDVRQADEASRWTDLPEVEMDDDTRARLAAAMPGALSELDRHEWIKHGTCFLGAGGADEYFDDTLVLVDALNASEVGGFLAANAGAEVEVAKIKGAFDAAFGAGAGARVRVDCFDDDGRALIQELWINLDGVVTADAPLAELILAADPAAASECERGLLDPAGLQ